MARLDLQPPMLPAADPIADLSAESARPARANRRAFSSLVRASISSHNAPALPSKSLERP